MRILSTVKACKNWDVIAFDVSTNAPPLSGADYELLPQDCHDDSEKLWIIFRLFLSDIRNVFLNNDNNNGSNNTHHVHSSINNIYFKNGSVDLQIVPVINYWFHTKQQKKVAVNLVKCLDEKATLFFNLQIFSRIPYIDYKQLGWEVCWRSGFI